MKHLFRTLVDQHQQRVYSQAMFILADKADAEDATQEAFERLWSSMCSKEFNTESAKPWLLHVVRNICICLLYTSPSPRDQRGSRMPSSA